MVYVLNRIQLIYDTEDGVQPVTLGVDPGAKTIGLSASTETKELFSAEVALRDNIPALLARRKAMRQHRRYRKTRNQEGVQADFWNTREYVLYRDGHTCQLCKGKSKDPVFSVHHIVSRRIGGNAPSNLICLCESCHDMIHKKGIKLKSIRKRSYKDATFMNLVKKGLFDALKPSMRMWKLHMGTLRKVSVSPMDCRKNITSMHSA